MSGRVFVRCELSSLADEYLANTEWTLHPRTHESYLVDPASSHMLVSKIKPCICQYKHVCTVKL